MKILISNDDGIHAPGLTALAEAASEFGEVTVVAPHRERSTAGHSLTLHKPLRIFDLGSNRFSTSGTPADCIYLGVRHILKEKPDLILSGINAGANLGTDVHYSGTVAAAREAALMNIRSYAFSLVGDRLAQHPLELSDYRNTRSAVIEVIKRTLDITFPKHTLLNINIPQAQGSPEIRVCRQGIRFYENHIEPKEDPRGRPYYWLGGRYEGFEPNDLSDCHAVEQGFVSVVPLTIDSTHSPFYDQLSTVFQPG